jgi:hypothetical protein
MDKEKCLQLADTALLSGLILRISLAAGAHISDMCTSVKDVFSKVRDVLNTELLGIMRQELCHSDFSLKVKISFIRPLDKISLYHYKFIDQISYVNFRFRVFYIY